MSIEKYLVLNKYMLSLLGVKDFKEIQSVFRNAVLGTNPSSGETYFCGLLKSVFQNKKLSPDNLDRYDSNIQSYLKHINANRQPKITLKYFQYLSILFTEIYLDMLKNNKASFLEDLNKFLESYKTENSVDLIDDFTEDDLNKIAFWMATGSGKTIISHINYYQFLEYNLFQPDNIIFITPNEGLSKQHYDEMKKSGIPAKLYSGTLNTSTHKKGEVLILEITKLVEEKKGKGKTIPVNAFEGRNLVFVDEGHKGKKSEEQKWSKLRDKLSENGFTFEYSATFGQVLNEKNPDTLAEYGKSIIMDYSYKYFYLDGYGKDFDTFNVKSAQKFSEKEYKETVFVANLLSYYEQLLAYKENKDIVSEYNIEKPLWIFVGSTVTNGKKSKEDEKTISDILDITLFLKRVLEDREWFENQIQNILKGKTAFKDEENNDIFSQKFQYLGQRQISVDGLYKEVFGSRGKFQVYEIANANGEFGLKAGDENYFGVINIGDVSGFKKKLEQNGIEVLQDVISQSLFDNIKNVSSTINILIGAKKFIEGWDTWRVSTMGLLNIGTGEGPQIIQLFGRGIRLKGKDMSLMRSGESTGNRFLKILETLQIYGIKANYIDKFLEAINKEVDLETLEIPVKFLNQNEWDSLFIPEKGNSDFRKSAVLKLEADSEIQVNLNLIPKAVAYSGTNRSSEVPVEATGTASKGVHKSTFSKEYIDVLDWDKIFLEVDNYSLDRGYFNIVISKESLKDILCSSCYISSITDPYALHTVEDINKLEDRAIFLLKSYLDKFYKREQQKADTKTMSYKTLEQKEQQIKHPFIKDGREVYTLKVERDKKNKDLIDAVKNLFQSEQRENWLDQIVKQNQPPNIYFDKHLFLPLLIETQNIEKIIPNVTLNESEKNFLEGVRDYYNSHKDKFENVDLFVLRNVPKSGVGFFLEWASFYPDFILWLKLKDNSKEMIVFVEPHGLIYSGNFNSDEKINFRETLKNIEEKVNAREKRNDVLLDYFLITPTSYEDLKKLDRELPDRDKFEAKHVFFFQDTPQWADKMFNEIFDELNKQGGEKQ